MYLIEYSKLRSNHRSLLNMFSLNRIECNKKINGPKYRLVRQTSKIIEKFMCNYTEITAIQLQYVKILYVSQLLTYINKIMVVICIWTNFIFENKTFVVTHFKTD